MRKARWLMLLIPLLALGCGPIIGQVMRVADGIKRFEFVRGSAGDLQGGGPLLVHGPFDKTGDAFYICRGEDAANFADQLRRAGLFETRLVLERDYERLAETRDRLRTMTPEELQSRYQLPVQPQWVLFGTLTHRETIVAPTRGVVMTVGYRLEFYDPASQRSVILAAGVRDLAQETIPRIVEELAERVGNGVP